MSCHNMSGHYSTRQVAAPQGTLREQVRRLREKADLPGWEVAAAAKMDSGLLSKIENGKRSVTQAQLAALAKFFKVEPGPLEARRIAEEMVRWHGDNPAFAEATAILHDEAGEYRVKKQSAAVSKPAKSVSKPKKKK